MEQTIIQTEQFFRSLGLETKLHEVGIGEETILKIKNRFLQEETVLGEAQNIDGFITEQILRQVL